VCIGIFASANPALSPRCQSPVALSPFYSPDQKKHCSLTSGAAARIGHEMWHSWGKLHACERARSTREGEGRGGQNIAAGRPPKIPHFGENDLSRNSRAQAHRTATGPRRLSGELRRGPSETAPRAPANSFGGEYPETQRDRPATHPCQNQRPVPVARV
jgi:hypothetical protein